LGWIEFTLEEVDLIFFNKIINSHPKAVKYQDVMDFLDDSLAYETKIKKIEAAKIRIDAILQSKKNIHDSRIKEMFLKIN